MNIDETHVVKLLATRHSEDVFVPQCMTGPAGSPIMDAWAMKRGWARPMTWGYEVKCTRRDFVQDDKMMAYMDVCNQMYLVCPRDVVKPEEVPEGWGLLYVASTGTRLLTKTKAKIRDIDKPYEVLKSILINRAQIGRDRRASATEMWEHWLEDKRHRANIGHMVSGRVGDMCRKLREENERLTREREPLMEVAEFCKRHGIPLGKDAYGNWIRDRRRDAMERVLSGIPKSAATDLRALLEHVKRAVASLDALSGRIDTVAKGDTLGGGEE